MKVWSWRQVILRTQLEPSTKLLLLALSTYMNDYGEGCYPSVEQICKDTGLSERSVFYHLKKAESEGFLLKDKRDLSGKKWAANEYRAVLPELAVNPHIEAHLTGSLSASAIIAVNNPEVQPLQPTENPTKSGAAIAPHFAEPTATVAVDDELRGAMVAVMGCNDCSDGVQQLHTNSSKNSPLNSKKVYPPKIENSYSLEFEQFWMTWPELRRCEKPKAHAAWQKACGKITPDELLAAAKQYLMGKEASSGFAPYVAKWLKNERWLEFDNKPILTINYIGNDIGGDIGGDTPENRDFLIILKILHGKLGEAIYRSWFAQLRLASKNGKTLILHAPTRFISEWVKRNYVRDIEQAAKIIWPEISDVRIEHNIFLGDAK